MSVGLFFGMYPAIKAAASIPSKPSATSDIVWRQAETEGQSNTSSTERKDGSHPTAAGEAPFWTTMTVKLKAAA